MSVMSKKNRETYLVNVTVLEGRHFAWTNMNSYVHVRVGKFSEKTKVRKHTDCPYFNQYFVFEFRKSLQFILDQTLTLTVMRPRRGCICKQMLGYIGIDLATIWEQTDHQFFRKWAILSSQKSELTGPRGYLKVTISILAAGQTPRIPLVDPYDDDEIEGNLLLPEGITLERHKALFAFKLYKGVDIIKKHHDFIAYENGEDHKSRNKKNSLPKTWVEITFAGLTAKSKVRSQTSFPAWNQSLMISELFPPLCQRIKIQLCYKYPMRRTVKCSKYLQIKSIASDKEHGFLPTFGPTFIHFYRKYKMGEEYAGKILIALETKLYSDIRLKGHTVIKDKVAPILESAAFEYETVLLFISILDVSMISKQFSRRDVAFELHWGRTKIKNKDLETGEAVIPHFKTKNYPTTSADHQFWHVGFAKEVPCLYIQKSLPDVRRRLFHSNMLEKAAYNVNSRLRSIEELLFHRDFTSNSAEIEEKLLELFDYFSGACRHIVEIINATAGNFVTVLDKEKTNHCIRELEDIGFCCHSAYSARMKKKSFRTAERLYKRLEALIDHPQECYPDIFLWMIYGDRRVSCVKIPVKHAIYAHVEEQMGIFCGKSSTFYYKPDTTLKSMTKIFCKIQAFIWLGLDRDRHICMGMLPKGYSLPDGLREGELPMYLMPSASIVRNNAVHIYQGRFFWIYHYNVLSDLFARAIVCEKTARTKMKNASMNPLWDQTLIFQQVIVYGTRQDIEENPPPILIEIIDQDKCCQLEYIGRSILTPAIKFVDQTYSLPKFPPKLQWYEVKNNKGKVGEILAAAELLEVGDVITKDDLIMATTIQPIPEDIKPVRIGYRLEVIFWGIRNLKRLHGCLVSKPRIIIELGEGLLSSETIKNPNHDLNFEEPLKCLDTNLPNIEDFVPPMIIKLYDSRCFGRNVYIGTNLAMLKQLIYKPITKVQWDKLMNGFDQKSYDSLESIAPSVHKIEIPIEKYYTVIDVPPPEKKKRYWLFRLLFYKPEKKYSLREVFHSVFSRKNKEDEVSVILEDDPEEEAEEVEDEFIDWWTKYYGSLEHKRTVKNANFKLKIYNNELEKEQHFQAFGDLLHKFKIYRGRTVGDEFLDSDVTVAVLKCNIKLYPWPPLESLDYVTPLGYQLKHGFFQGFPVNEPQGFLVRVYCVRGIKLRPADVMGKCDPYLIVKMGSQVQNDHKNYIPRNVNPIFGKCFEMKGIFPKDHSLTISVFDWDRVTASDLIGTTTVDLENRFYSKHRGQCGLQFEYKEAGPTPWRDQNTPMEVLEERCRLFNLELPEYSTDSVRVGVKIFSPNPESIPQNDRRLRMETLALYVLHNWHQIPVVGCHLVPEHVETRSLYNPNNPGIEQGKLQMWIDIFPLTDVPPPDMVDIKPRNPETYQLRVIIWNVEEVVMNESDLFGERKSDIYVKGWMAKPNESQKTDVHYRSLTGEGNFNWRFIFDFDYLSTENRIIFKKKDNVFNIDESEMKLPCRLKLQVWDLDYFSPDDFLGALTMDLNRLPRGAVSAKRCSLHQLDKKARTTNIFKVKRMRGWWPFTNAEKNSNVIKLTGKLEAELQLLTAEEAVAEPAGLGRGEPQPLPFPKRPETSFSWILNPWKTCRFIIWKNMKVKVIQCAILGAIILFAGLAIYNIPGYSVKKLLGA